MIQCRCLKLLVMKIIHMLYKIHLMDQKNVYNHVKKQEFIIWLILILHQNNVSVIVLLLIINLYKMDIVNKNVLKNMLDLHLVMYVIVNVIIILILMLNNVLLIITVLLQDMTLFVILLEDMNVYQVVIKIHM